MNKHSFENIPGTTGFTAYHIEVSNATDLVSALDEMVLEMMAESECFPDYDRYVAQNKNI